MAFAALKNERLFFLNRLGKVMPSCKRLISAGRKDLRIRISEWSWTKQYASFLSSQTDAASEAMSTKNKVNYTTGPKVYLNVPLEQKHSVKYRGALWDETKAMWYVPAHRMDQIKDFEQWISKEPSAVSKPLYDLPPVRIKKGRTTSVKASTISNDNSMQGSSNSNISTAEVIYDANDELVVIYDIETTGLFKNRPNYTQLGSFDTCRIVQMSYVVCLKSNFEIVEQADVIVKADDFIIENSRFHGVTTERSHAEGISFSEAAGKLIQSCSKASYLIAHNASFDCLVTKSELHRYKLHDYLEKFGKLKVICSMLKTKHVVRCMLSNKRTLKNPKLRELYEYAINEPIQNEHNAMHDVLNLHAALKALVVRQELTDLFD